MKFSLVALIVLPVALLSLGGCMEGGKQQRTYNVKQQSSLDKAKVLLKGYANGAPLGSEGDDFPSIVEGVRKEAPAKADMLEQGFANIRKNPGTRAAVAKSLLPKL